MAIFRLPPGPFTGGRQPYDNKDLISVGVTEDNPPFNSRRNAILLAIVFAWQPIQDTPQKFQQVVQESVQVVTQVPYVRQLDYYKYLSPVFDLVTNRKLPPSLIAVPEDTVLKIKDIGPILQYWQITEPTRFIKTYFPITPEEVSVTPIFSQRIELRIIAQWWNQTPPLVIRPNQFVNAVQVDNPPINNTRFWLPIILELNKDQGWDSQFRKLNPNLIAVTVNNPPFGQRYWVNTIREMWEPTPPLPYHPPNRYSPPSIISEVIIWIWRRIA